MTINNINTINNTVVPYEINPGFIACADADVISSFNAFLSEFEELKHINLSDDSLFRTDNLDIMPFMFALYESPGYKVHHDILTMMLFASSYGYWKKVDDDVKANRPAPLGRINNHNNDRCESESARQSYIVEAARKFGYKAIGINSKLKAKGYPCFLYRWDMKTIEKVNKFTGQTETVSVPTDEQCLIAAEEFTNLYCKIMREEIFVGNWKNKLLSFQRNYC